MGIWACNSVGRVLPLQGRSREFESHQVHLYGAVAQLGRAPALQAGGQGFDSPQFQNNAGVV